MATFIARNWHYADVTMPADQPAKMRLRKLRPLRQKDLSNSVVHFVGRVPLKENRDVPVELRRMGSRERLRES
jgi:hypothetical protein